MYVMAVCPLERVEMAQVKPQPGEGLDHKPAVGVAAGGADDGGRDAELLQVGGHVHGVAGAVLSAQPGVDINAIVADGGYT